MLIALDGGYGSQAAPRLDITSTAASGAKPAVQPLIFGDRILNVCFNQ